MNRPVDRRSFLETSAAAGAAFAAGSYFVSEAPAQESRSPNSRISAVLMGANGRGGQLAVSYLAQPNTQIGYVADVDERVVERMKKSLGGRQEHKAEGVADFRRALDDKNIDVLFCAAPNHWHAPATILGCSAGKHVYCEKPACHNPREGELAVAAARKKNRVVQLGTQRRSDPALIEAIENVHNGEIGPVH
jgi:predicted dehydrogenase